MIKPKLLFKVRVAVEVVSESRIQLFMEIISGGGVARTAPNYPGRTQSTPDVS